MTPAERRDRIIEALRGRPRVTVEFLAGHLGISRETVRRDLAALDRERVLKKVHGGAVALPSARPDAFAEGPFADRMLDAERAKRAIGRRAAALLSGEDSLFVDTGSTTIHFAEELGKLAGLSIITNSASIATSSSKGQRNRVHLLGGEFRCDGQETLGPTTVEQIEQLRARHAFLTVGGIDGRSVSDFDVQEAHVARAMIRSARQVTVLADASKFDRQGVFEVAQLSRIDRLVTDRVPAAIRADLEAAGVEVILAEEESSEP